MMNGLSLMKKFYFLLVRRDKFDTLSNIVINLYFNLNKRFLGNFQSLNPEFLIKKIHT